jgi:hypothetical protein
MGRSACKTTMPDSENSLSGMKPDAPGKDNEKCRLRLYSPAALAAASTPLL